MALIVHKYGGTSMGSTERIRNVAKRVAKWARAGHQMVVVPSAMSGETNRLLGLAKELSPESITQAVQREMDAIACTGEQVSVGLLSIALQAEGMQAVHEAGHVFGAWATGGRVARVVLHPLTISRTDLEHNPYPLAVVWAGPVFGVVVPVVLPVVVVDGTSSRCRHSRRTSCAAMP